jgi:acyl carrier protein
METTWEEIEKRAKQIIVDELGLEGEEEATLEANIIRDLGADSLDTIEIIMRFEEEFEIEVSNEEAEKIATVEDIMKYLVQTLPETKGTKITSKVLAFRVHEDGRVHVGLQTTDGTWIYADGTSFLPAGIYLTVFSKWGDVLKELEEMINSPSVAEQDLQIFFEKYPELLKCDEYDVIIPQARIITEEEVTWRADFVLHPFDQNSFCKVLELKLPQASTARQPSHGHLRVYNELLLAINQLKDYGEAFHSTDTRQRFKEAYKINVFKPDLQLIAGRKWDMLHMRNMLEVQRRNGVRVDNWDTCLEKLRRQFT